MTTITRYSRVYLLLLMVVAIIGGAGIAGVLEAAPAQQQTAGGAIPLTAGWYQGRDTYYYSFANPIPTSDGGQTVDTAPIYVLFHENGQPVAGQYNIIDVVPGEPGYSDLWQVNMVTVPNDYVANTVTSYAGIVTAGYPVTPTNTLVNCPIVAAGTGLQYSQMPLVQGWHDGSPVYYFDFGMNPVTTAPIYAFFYADDMPVPGQRNVVDTIPGEAGYSDFWRVHKVTVPDDYQANSAKSLADIQAAGYTITPTAILVNCPIVRTEGEPVTFQQTAGWYRDQYVNYYSFANPVPSPDNGATVTPAPIYVLFYQDGSPVPGQNNVVDVVPEDAGYSDLWQVHMVTVPDDYVANTIRSYQQIVDGGYTVTPTSMLVNCPVVPAGSNLAGGEVGLTQGWYRGQEVYYFDFGPNPAETAPIYAFFYADGSPVAGQRNIVDTVPGAAGYSAFWQVHAVTVPDDYVANTIRSAADLMASGYPIQVTDIVVNCPVVRTVPTDVSLTEVGGTASTATVALPLLLAGAVALVVGLVLFRYRRRQSPAAL